MGALLFSEKKFSHELTCSYSLGDSWILNKLEDGKIKPTQLEENSTFGQNISLHTKDGALCEFRYNDGLVRIGANSVFEFTEDGIIKLSRGSMLIALNHSVEITIQSEFSLLKTNGKYTAIIDCTSNGGFKFIPLEGNGEIIPEQGDSKDIYRGRLTMVLDKPSRLGNAYDIDLLLLLKSSRLINSFPTPLPSIKKISLSVYAQQLKLKGKFNALIGDAPTDDNLQMWAFGDDNPKK